ncbi:MAG: indolepyruvate oxidoreductase subunit beta family protein [Rhizobiales bacterium]|nr:indolepyruvate oxidoreductase subunit beta family protein [Hyphomicrobiales bacterium]OJY44937.1 MAG: indolepyruvate oxidoreductase subunit B [Rhizobiales bacterium 64-17]
MNALTPIPGISTKPISVAVLAMGGQGGGVLMDWIVALAESQGFIAQSTSVPGVAQRTGATIYYVEMIKARPDGVQPVLSLMPEPGHVDVVVGAELMEAGRAILRGLVTPEQTTLIASSHRSFAVQEKIAPGDGIGDPDKVFEAAQVAARRFIAFDMAQIAEQTGSAISAVLFGALAASGTLPFARGAYEETIKAAGVGVAGSLRAFAAGFDATAAATAPVMPPPVTDIKIAPALAPIGHPGFDALVARAQNEFTTTAHGMLAAGLRRVVDFQDVAYGGEYLDLVAALKPFARDGNPELLDAAAKYIATAMAYDDVIRVADLKTRATRFARVRAEVAVADEQLVYMTEFMHPRMDEVAGTLPAGLGEWIEARPRLFRALDRVVNKGRRVQTGTIRWFLPLYILGGMRRFRRGSLRHKREVAHRDHWLAAVCAAAAHDHALAVEMLQLRRLVKGYSDTHARGLSKFDRALAAAQRLAGRSDAADWTRRLRQAALADEEGTALTGAIATVDSFLADEATTTLRH